MLSSVLLILGRGQPHIESSKHWATNTSSLSNSLQSFVFSRTLESQPAYNPQQVQITIVAPPQDSYCFPIPEIRFSLQLTAFPSPRSDPKVAGDHRKVTREIKRGKRISPSHARILPKAIEYWKSRYKEKFVDWKRRAMEANEDRRFAGGATGAL
jgi:hypothetical protein